MAMVKVWNDNDYPHTETYKGKQITIAPHASIEMEWEEAIQFRGQFTPIVVRGDGTHDPRSFKKIRVEDPPEPTAEDNSLICHATGKKASTPEELAALLAANAHLLVKDPEAEAEAKRLAAAKADEVADLKKQVEELRAMLTRGPGKARKEA